MLNQPATSNFVVGSLSVEVNHVHAGSLSNYKEVSDQRDVNINRKSQGAHRCYLQYLRKW